MANWTLQYRSTGITYIPVVVGPDPTVLAIGAATILAAKKQLLQAAEELNALEVGAPTATNMKRVLSDLAGYEYVLTSATNNPTTVKAKLALISAAAAIEDSPTSPVRTSAFGTFPATTRSVGMEEDRGNVTMTNGVPSAVTERKEWRVSLV